MTELEKYELINSCESVTELEKAILMLADENGYIKGRQSSFRADLMSAYVFGVVNASLPANYLTRSYGIRQQALYLSYYNKW